MTAVFGGQALKKDGLSGGIKCRGGLVENQDGAGMSVVPFDIFVQQLPAVISAYSAVHPDLGLQV